MVGVILGVAVLIITGYLILSKAKAQAVLLTSGILLMAMGAYLGTGEILEKSTGSTLLDIYEKIRAILASRGGGLGLSIMAVAGYARFMDKIGASQSMVRILSNPLQKLSSPYMVMSATYIIGEIMAQFITSASGLGMLLMVTLYPTLISLGVSRLSAVATIGTTMAIEWGIMETNTIYAAEVAGMPVSQYFMEYQLIVGCTVVVAIAITHFFVQRWFDAKAGPDEEVLDRIKTEEHTEAPLYYAILPTLPLILLIGYLLFDNGREVHLVTVIMISITICMLVEFCRGFKLKPTFASLQQFFDGMGVQFANVVTLIVAGETFAHGLKVIGAVDAAINAAQGTGFGAMGVLIIMVVVIAGCAIVMGSGNAPFFSFAGLIPSIAKDLGVPAVMMIMPMHFATSLARGISPITAVIVVTSGIAGVSPFDVVKRTVIPMVVGLIVNLTMTIMLFY